MVSNSSTLNGCAVTAAATAAASAARARYFTALAQVTTEGVDHVHASAKGQFHSQARVHRAGAGVRQKMASMEVFKPLGISITFVCGPMRLR